MYWKIKSPQSDVTVFAQILVVTEMNAVDVIVMIDSMQIDGMIVNW